MTDPLSDTLARVKNALALRADEVELRYSKLIERVIDVMSKEGFVGGFEVTGEGVNKAIRLKLKYHQGAPAIRMLKRISRPGRRVFRKAADLLPSNNGYGIFIVSTNKGIVIDKEVRRSKIGGEVLVEVH